MRESTKTAVAVAVVIFLGAAFWLLLLAPKREKADELAQQVSSLHADVATEEARADAALAAKREFPRNYEQLLILGKAVPAEAATPSLLVQLNGVSARAKTSFRSISINGGGDSVKSEADAATLPLGAITGPAGLSAMPYTLEFNGGFFGIADFIHGLDSLVETKDGEVIVNGRLVTIDGFNLTPENDSPVLKATFSVSTYVTPPGQGLTAGATASGPAETTSVQP